MDNGQQLIIPQLTTTMSNIERSVIRVEVGNNVNIIIKDAEPELGDDKNIPMPPVW